MERRDESEGGDSHAALRCCLVPVPVVALLALPLTACSPTSPLGSYLVKRPYFSVYLDVNLHVGLRTSPALWDRLSPSAWLYFSQPLIDVNLL